MKCREHFCSKNDFLKKAGYLDFSSQISRKMFLNGINENLLEISMSLRLFIAPAIVKSRERASTNL